MFAILGSGFGLYGYLPALIEGCGETVLLPQRYREKLMGREDVSGYIDQIEWRRDEAAILDEAQGVIIARRPSEQPALARECLGRANIKKILLEKPLAPSPAESATLLDELEASGKTFRIGYNFRLTGWGRKVLASPPETLVIDWTFRAHHYANNLHNWKRADEAGGGALRFFGIHLVALMAEMGYDDVLSSSVRRHGTEDTYFWQAALSAPDERSARITVDADNPVTGFSADGIAALREPFEETSQRGKLDKRVDLLTALCRDLRNGPAFYPWYRDSIDLWAKIEQQTTYD
jgi:predicted dehydrogenase